MADAIIKNGITLQVVQFCAARGGRLREDALEVVSHLSSGGEDSMQALMDADCISALETCIPEYARSRSKACSLVADIARGTPSHVKALIESPLLHRVLRVTLNLGKAFEARTNAARMLLNLAQTATMHLERLDPGSCQGGSKDTRDSFPRTFATIKGLSETANFSSTVS